MNFNETFVKYDELMDLRALQQISLDVARVRPTRDVLRGIVSRLAEQAGVALVRIWLRGPADICERCPLRSECNDRRECMHLEASAGRSRVDPQADWSRIDGRFRRFPLGVRKIGRIAQTGKAELLVVDEEQRWIVDRPWAEREGIRAFAGQPLVFRGEILGILGVFSREPIDVERFGWLRTFADHAAVALANARAFAEVEELRRQLELERDYLRERLDETHSIAGIVGESPAIRQVMRQVELVAPSEASVLVVGESGTGKELVATAIHQQSERREGALVRVNCASIPRELFESEFFGHAKGAFTGAVSERAGRFQVADGGTLFLDEIGEIPLELQGKLLRVLQEGEFSRVGEDRVHQVDVRIVAATNRDLETEVHAGRFREDLYYRVSVFPIRVPPLRERKQDIPALAAHFVECGKRRLGLSTPRLRRRDLQLLCEHDWRGNVRELQNVIERALILASGDRLSFDLQPTRIGTPSRPPPARAGTTEVMLDEQMQALVRANLVAALERCHWKVSGAHGAALLLGLNPNTLASRMRALGIRRP